ncbi:MAG: hypothetical protein PVI74_07000 [Syntrophobacterales bacterium]
MRNLILLRVAGSPRLRVIPRYFHIFTLPRGGLHLENLALLDLPPHTGTRPYQETVIR